MAEPGDVTAFCRLAPPRTGFTHPHPLIAPARVTSHAGSLRSFAWEVPRLVAHLPHPTPRSALKVWRTERLRPSARCATERPRRSPDREETPRPRLTRQDPALRSSLVSLPCKPWALVALGGVFAGDRLPTRPLLSLDYLANSAPTRASPCRDPRVSDGSLPLIQAVRSHRYGLGECHPLPFRSLSGQRDGFRLRLRLCALASLNSRGMVVTPYNRLDAPDVHARQAHHRTSGGSPPRLPSSSDGGQGAGVRKYGIKHNFNIRLHIPLKRSGSPSLAPQGGRGVLRSA